MTMRFRPNAVSSLSVILVGGAMAAACGDGSTVTAGSNSTGGSSSGASSSGGNSSGGAATGGSATGGTGGVTIPTGGGVGDACGDADPCRPGLNCTSGACELGGDTEQGSPCIVAGECQDGLQCIAQLCAPAGTGEVDTGCQTDAECMDGLRCNLVGFGAKCQPEGTTDVLNSCTGSAECYAGLACIQGQCLPAPAGLPPFGIPTSPVLDCAEPSTGTVRAYFEVPGANPAGDEGDFFRLPFPNDARIAGGKVDLSGFPVPGPGLLPFDPVKLYVDAVEATESAWSANPVVFFRFSGGIDIDSLREPNPQTDPATRPVRTVDLDDAGGGSAVNWFYSGGGGNYICHNWMAIRRRRALEPEHTYAYFLTTDGRASDGGALERAPHLVALLAPTPPSDPKLAAAHAAYAKFRSYLTTEGISPDTILNASVFTVAPVRDTMANLAAAVKAEPAPAATGWVKCGGATASPCPQADAADNRACGADNSAYDEYHALVSLPIYQTGTAPYLASGGGIDSSSVQRNEDVCMALTVPKGATMPAGGWPLVVYAHGTGGSFRSHIRDDVAGTLSSVTTPSGSVAFAVLGIDQVQHGPRRGSSTESPDTLFFNFANPDAARGNPLQGAADQISLGRFGAALDIDGATSGGDAIKVDPNAIVFFGHSQGSTHGSLGVPYSEVYTGTVLSGNGAVLRDSLVTKTQPVNIAAALPLVLGDFDSTGGLRGGLNHPVLSVLQHWIDPADPANFARTMGIDPPTGIAPKSTFVTYGLGDSYSTNQTIQNYIMSGRFTVVAADSSANPADDLGTEQPAPLSGNQAGGGTPFTWGARQYGPPAGRDGHFVVFDVAAANGDVARFLGMAAQGVAPDIGQ